MSPLKANTGYYHSGGDGSGWGRNGIIDTRFLVQGHDGSALFNFERKREMPNMPWFDEGLDFKRAGDRVRIGGHGPAVGFFGFAAGPGKTIIDLYGLGDPLLARLPTRSPDWYGGHFERQLPEGYEASVRTGMNKIVDSDLHAYYDKLLLVTQGSVFTGARLRAIFELNTGRADRLLQAYCN
jgi:arabinofuranosyltransferase